MECIIGLVLIRCIWSDLKSAFIFGVLFSGRPECLNCLCISSRDMADWALYTYKSYRWPKRKLSRVEKQYSFAVYCQNSWWTKGQRMCWVILKTETTPLDGVKRPAWSSVDCPGKRKKAEIAPAKGSALWGWIGGRQSFQLCWEERTPCHLESHDFSRRLHAILLEGKRSLEDHSNFVVIMQRTSM